MGGGFLGGPSPGAKGGIKEQENRILINIIGGMGEVFLGHRSRKKKGGC